MRREAKTRLHREVRYSTAEGSMGELISAEETTQLTAFESVEISSFQASWESVYCQ